MTDRHRFGRIEIDLATRQLLVDGRPAPLGARAFDLLQLLLEERHRVVGKDELLARVWPGLVVEENNLQVQVSTLRKLMGAAAITTLPGRGYRFTLREDEPAAAVPAPPTAPAGRPGAPGAGDPAPGDPAPGDPAPERPPARPPAPDLVGRDDDLAALHEALGVHRLVTLVGSGGLGKTVLARALARQAAARWPDGPFWVDLTTLADAGTHGEALTLAVAHAIGVPLPEREPLAALCRALSQRTLLLVLDNAEHLVAGLAAVLPALLERAPGLRVLATSQVALHVPLEQAWRLGALVVPDEGADLAAARACSAFELFERRARAIDQRFALGGDDVAAAVALCRRLEGHPLAIELAAARAPQLGLAVLNARLADRLRLLRGHAAGLPVRQQSLRAMLDWSCGLLAEGERQVLWRLSVFAGPFALEAAQAVAADDPLDEWAVLDALEALADRSLLQFEGGATRRYRLAEATRLYAAELLSAAGGTDPTLRRHARAMARLAPSIVEDALRLPAAAFLERHAAVEADLEAAFERAAEEGDAEVAGWIGQALVALDGVRGVATRRRRRMAAAHALLPAAHEPLARARLLNLAAPVSSIALPGVPRLALARERVDAWRALGDTIQVYVALAQLAEEQARAGAIDDARATAAECAALEDPAWPPALRMIGTQVHADIGLYAPDDGGRGLAALHRLLELARQSGDPRRIALVRFRLADHASGHGDAHEAVALGSACVADPVLASRPLLLGIVLANLCSAQLQLGDDAAARLSARRALPLLKAQLYGGVLFNHLALLAARAGDMERSARLIGWADRWYAGNQTPRRQPTEQRVYGPALSLTETALGAPVVERLRQEGSRLDEAQADALAAPLLGP